MEIDREKIEKIAEKYSLTLLLLFGSRASGKTHKESDYDFGYIGKKDMSYSEKGNLDVDLARLIKNEAESVDLKNAGPFLLKEIVKNNQIIFEENGAYSDFFSRAVRIYFDAKPIFKLQEIIYSKAVNKYQKQYAK